MTMTRTYSELRRLSTLEERYEYLALGGIAGESTFGFDRWINQRFYHSREWRLVRSEVIARDLGFDLGAEDVPIRGPHLIHHMNPLTLADIDEATENLINPEFLISTALRTHNAIHYGDKSLLPQPFVERRPGDTKLW
jgi:hypothetical protein